MDCTNPYRLQIRVIPQGNDYVWLVTGGDAHVGAVALAYWDGERAVAQVLTVPAHKETELALELAELVCSRMKATVTVAAGIHIDGATKDEIHCMVEEVRRLARLELEVWENLRNKSNLL
jgi:gallate decarboxylase subunit D